MNIMKIIISFSAFISQVYSTYKLKYEFTTKLIDEKEIKSIFSENEEEREKGNPGIFGKNNKDKLEDNHLSLYKTSKFGNIDESSKNSPSKEFKTLHIIEENPIKSLVNRNQNNGEIPKNLYIVKEKEINEISQKIIEKTMFVKENKALEEKSFYLSFYEFIIYFYPKYFCLWSKSREVKKKQSIVKSINYFLNTKLSIMNFFDFNERFLKIENSLFNENQSELLNRVKVKSFKELFESRYPTKKTSYKSLKDLGKNPLKEINMNKLSLIVNEEVKQALVEKNQISQNIINSLNKKYL